MNVKLKTYRHVKYSTGDVLCFNIRFQVSNNNVALVIVMAEPIRILQEPI